MARRYPAQIGNWRVSEGYYDTVGLAGVLTEEVALSLGRRKAAVVLLSGGLDSAILARLTMEVQRAPHFLTLGRTMDSPDVQAACRLAKEWDLTHTVFFPSSRGIQAARDHVNRRTYHYPGDEGVFLACMEAPLFGDLIIAGDGIDEQMGGYWGHRQPLVSDGDPSALPAAFERYWQALEPEHLRPMYRSCCDWEIDVDWPYLHEPVIDYIARVPLAERVKDGVGKAFWREVAQYLGVPQWVIDRPKRGFCDALSTADSRSS